MAKQLLADTSFWFALYEERDQWHDRAKLLADVLRTHAVVIPWPCLYETLNTRFAKRTSWIRQFDRILTRSDTKLVDDSPYREQALRAFLQQENKSFSLTDIVVRQILRESSIKIGILLTFNARDFWDICNKRNIELVGADFEKRVR